MTPPSQNSTVNSARTAQQRQGRARPRAVTRRLARSRLGWDRKFRVLMLVAVGLVGWVAFGAALSMYHAYRQAGQEGALVQSLRTQNRSLSARAHALTQPATIMRDARQLGMVAKGERPYSVIGQSSH